MCKLNHGDTNYIIDGLYAHSPIICPDCEPNFNYYDFFRMKGYKDFELDRIVNEFLTTYKTERC